MTFVFFKTLKATEGVLCFSHSSGQIRFVPASLAQSLPLEAFLIVRGATIATRDHPLA